MAAEREIEHAAERVAAELIRARPADRERLLRDAGADFATALLARGVLIHDVSDRVLELMRRAALILAAAELHPVGRA